MKMVMLSLLLFCAACLLSACAKRAEPVASPTATLSGAQPTSAPAYLESQAAYQKITPEQAKDMMERGTPYVLLDVRTQQEFDAQRIDGAVLIPDNEIARAEAELPDKNATILVYCRSGRRSEAAARKLVDMGYTNVFDFGGILDWPYETVRGRP